MGYMKKKTIKKCNHIVAYIEVEGKSILLGLKSKSLVMLTAKEAFGIEVDGWFKKCRLCGKELK